MLILRRIVLLADRVCRKNLCPHFPNSHGNLHNISSLREEMHRGFDEIHTILNTDISPRLKTIEDCYLKTFERYSESVERQKKMEEDISVMKDVIQEHSVQLQKLCS
jgi:hypothetical protein